MLFCFVDDLTCSLVDRILEFSNFQFDVSEFVFFFVIAFTQFLFLPLNHDL